MVGDGGVFWGDDLPGAALVFFVVVVRFVAVFVNFGYFSSFGVVCPLFCFPLGFVDFAFFFDLVATLVVGVAGFFCVVIALFGELTALIIFPSLFETTGMGLVYFLAVFVVLYLCFVSSPIFFPDDVFFFVVFFFFGGLVVVENFFDEVFAVVDVVDGLSVVRGGEDGGAVLVLVEEDALRDLCIFFLFYAFFRFDFLGNTHFFY